MKIEVNWMWVITLPVMTYGIASERISWFVCLVIILAGMELFTTINIK